MAEHLSTTTTTKFDNTLRRHVYTLKLKINEVLEQYQTAYLKQVESEKEDKRLNKELKETGKVKCPYCSQTVYKK